MAAELLTIAEAARALNVEPQRVSQLLASGGLDGPPLPAGRHRHAPNAPRVTAESIARRQASRQNLSRKSPGAHAATGGAPADAIQALAAAQELKVRLDVLRDEAQQERARSAKLLDVIDVLVGLLRESTASNGRLDEVAEGYSQALTQMLSRTSPPPE